MNKKVEIVKYLLHIAFLNVYAVSVNATNLKIEHFLRVRVGVRVRVNPLTLVQVACSGLAL